MNVLKLLIPSYRVHSVFYAFTLVMTIVLSLPLPCYAQSNDFDSDGVIDLFDVDTDNDGISNVLEDRCSDDSILYNWEEAADPSGDNNFTWSAVDGYRRDMTITTNHPTTVDNIGTPQTSSGYLEMGMNVSDVTDDAQITVYELIFSEPTSISAISILDIDSQTGFTFSSYGDGVKLEFYDAYGVELPQNLVLGQALVQNANGIVLPIQQNIPAAISNQDNWATYSSDELVTTIRIIYHSLNLAFFDDPGDQYIYVGDLRICTPEDSDGDGIPNYVDLDSDNDGIPDAIEACGDIGVALEECSLDANGDAEYLDDNFDNLSDGLVVNHCIDGPIDTDIDGIPDYIDLDSDNDGCADSAEALTDVYGTSLLDYFAGIVDQTGLLLSGVSNNCQVPITTHWVDSTINEECICNLEGQAIVSSYCSSSLSDGGTVEITWTEGSPPYQISGDFTIENSTTSQVFDGLEAGFYTVTISDAGECESKLSFTIEEFQSPIITSVEAMIECDTDVGQILLTWSEGEGPFSLSGDFAAAEIESPYLIADVAIGDYSLVLSDINGCRSESNVTLVPKYPVEGSITYACEGSDFYSVIMTTQEPIDISTTGYLWNQINPITYQLSQIPIATSLEVIINATGQDCPTMYDITPPDCTCTAEAILPSEAIITCDNPVITLDGSASSTGPNYTYVWFSPTGVEIGNGLTIEVSEGGVYTLEVVDNVLECGTLAQLDVISEKEPPIAEIITESTVLTCNESEIVLSVLPIDDVIYGWNLPGEALQLLGETQLVTQSGEVTLIATNTINGCSSETTLIIEEDIEVPPITIVAPQILSCEIETVQLEAINVTMSQDLIVQWLDTADNSINDEGELTSIVDSPGFYVLQSTNMANGCIHRDTIEVIEQSIYPEVDLIDQISLTCASPSITLSPQVNLAAGDYISMWEYKGEIISTENSIDASSTGTYQLSVVHTETRCETVVFVEVFEATGLEEVILSTQDPSCYQSNDGSIDVLDIAAGTPPYQYFVEGNIVDLPLENLSEGSYQIQVIDDEGCEVIIEAVLTSPPPVFLSADADTTITVPYGEDVTIELSTNSSNINTVEWSPMIDCDNCLDYEITNVTENQTYIINLVDAAGCEAQEEVRIIVEYDIKLFLPNILVYGTDDALYPQTANPDIYITNFDVYDRWGNLIFNNGGFDPNDPFYGWDAMIDGSAAQAGVYVYHIQFTHPVQGEQQIVGDVTLLW